MTRADEEVKETEEEEEEDEEEEDGADDDVALDIDIAKWVQVENTVD